MRRYLTTVLKLAVGLGLIAFALSRVPRGELVDELTHANPWLVVLAMLVFWLAMVVNAAKWQVLLRARMIVVPFGAILNYTFVGFFFNNFLPASIGGDFMRGYGLARYTDRNADAAASVVLDRLIGLSAYMSVAAVAALLTVYVTGYSELRVLAWAAVTALGIVAIVAGILLSRRLRHGVDRLLAPTFLRPLAHIWSALSQAFEAYRFAYGALALAFGVGLLGILCTSLVNFILSEALGGGITLLQAFLFTPLIALVLIIPISIGGLGLNQVAYPYFYGLVGVPTAHAIGLSLLIQFVQIVCSLPGGVLWLRWRRRAPGAPSPIPDHA